MPNWCSTEIYINHEDDEKLKELYNKIEYWTSKDWVENGFGHNWLGNVVEGSGIGTYEEYRCRGSIVYMDISSGQITISTETAWCPMLKMWQAVVDKYLPDAEIIYTADECGCEIYYTNDPYYVNKYYVDIFDDDIYYDWTKKSVVEWLQEVLDTKEPNVDKLINMMYEADEDIGSVHKWKYVDISELD